MIRRLQASADALKHATELMDFNKRGRDAWVAEMDAAVPVGSRVLDVGAGTTPYRHLYALPASLRPLRVRDA
jgi:hypothetical protein